MPRFLLIVCLFMSFVSRAELVNRHEGVSSFIGTHETKEIERLKTHYSEEMLQSTADIITKNNSLTSCGTSFIQELSVYFNRFSKYQNKKDIKAFLYLLRENNYIDDVSLKILIKNYGLLNAASILVTEKPDEQISVFNQERLLTILKSWRDGQSQSHCFDQEFKGLYSKVKSISPEIGRREFGILLSRAYNKNILTKNEAILLTKANQHKLDEWTLTLEGYHKKRKALKRLAPDRKDDFTHFVNSFVPHTGSGIQTVFEEDKTYREVLFEKYSSEQILYLSQYIVRLKNRINALDVYIDVYVSEDELQERIELTPMEQYRFAGKMVRRELVELKNSQMFRGVQVSYLDLVVAAFEVGVLSSEELEFISAVEELWNPKISKKEKVLLFIKKYGPLGAMFLPPGIQYAVPLALIVIETMTNEAKPNGAQDEYNMF